jgi:hypothetical protein
MAASQGRRTGETVFTEIYGGNAAGWPLPSPVDHGTEGIFQQRFPDFSQM